MEDEKTGSVRASKPSLTSIRGTKSAKGRTADSKLETLKNAAQLAAEEIVSMLSDDMQFRRHLYAEKGTGEIMETTLSTRNVKQLRETIAAIRDLADTVRSLYGLLPPEAQSGLDIQMKKLLLDEKKLVQAESSGGETGVVLLPAPEDAST